MRLKPLFLLAALFLSTTALSQVPPPTSVDPASRLLDRWAKALGGRERLAAVRLIYTRAAVEGGGLKGTAESWQDSRGRRREQTELGSVKELTVFDGTQGWTRDTTGKVRALGGTDLENQITGAYLSSYSQFFPDRMAGKVEYAGEEGGAAKLRILPQGGTPATIYLDKNTGLPLREERPNEERTLTFYFEQWKDWDGIKLPGSVRQGTGDPSYDASATMLEVKINAPVEAAVFAKPESFGKDFNFANDAPSITLPIEINSNHIYLQARINGSRSLWCIFDSGAEGTVVNADRMAELGLKAEGKLEGRGAGGRSVQVGIINDARVEFAGGTMNERPIASIPLASIEPHEGREIDAIIGYDIISSFVVEIDYAGRRLTLHDPAKFTGTGRGEAVPFIFEGNLPIIAGTVTLPGQQPLPGRFLIDTGARMGLELNAPFVRTHDIMKAVPNAFPATGGFGVGGATKNYVARLAQFKVGNVTLDSPVVYLSQDERGGGANPFQAGTIGGEVLRRFTVSFDYGKQIMYLAPNATLREPFEYDMSGMGLDALGPDFRRFQVTRVIEKSPAALAGVQTGDLLVGFDGKPASGYTLEEIQNAFRHQPGREFRLEFERDGKTPPVVVLKTRRLI